MLLVTHPVSLSLNVCFICLTFVFLPTSTKQGWSCSCWPQKCVGSCRQCRSHSLSPTTAPRSEAVMTVMMMNVAVSWWQVERDFWSLCEAEWDSFSQVTPVCESLSWCMAEKQKKGGKKAANNLPHTHTHACIPLKTIPPEDSTTTVKDYVCVYVCVFPDLYSTACRKFTRAQESDLFWNNKGRCFSLPLCPFPKRHYPSDCYWWFPLI